MIIFGGFVPSVAGGTPSEMPMAECDSGGSVLSARRRSSSRHARGDAEGHHKQPPQPHQQHRQHQQHQHQHQHQRGSYSNALYALHLERRSWSLPTVHLAHASAHHGASPPHRYALHLERRSWSLPTVHLAPGAAPPSARLGASAVAVHDVEVLLFGGSHEGVPTAALDRLQLVSGDDGAAAMTATLQVGQSLVHGMQVLTTAPPPSPQVGQPLVHGMPPAPRSRHTAVLLGHSDMAVFGGCGGPSGRMALGDVALLDTARWSWSVLEFRGVPPVPRLGCIGAVVSAEPRRLWVFGGCAALDALPRMQVLTTASSFHRCAALDALPLNDVITLDISAGASATNAATVHVAAALTASAATMWPTVAGKAPDEARCEGRTTACALQMHACSTGPSPPPRVRLAPSRLQLTTTPPKRPLRELPPIIEAQPPLYQMSRASVDAAKKKDSASPTGARVTVELTAAAVTLVMPSAMTHYSAEHVRRAPRAAAVSVAAAPSTATKEQAEAATKAAAEVAAEAAAEAAHEVAAEAAVEAEGRPGLLKLTAHDFGNANERLRDVGRAFCSGSIYCQPLGATSATLIQSSHVTSALPQGIEQAALVAQREALNSALEALIGVDAPTFERLLPMMTISPALGALEALNQAPQLLHHRFVVQSRARTDGGVAVHVLTLGFVGALPTTPTRSSAWFGGDDEPVRNLLVVESPDLNVPVDHGDGLSYEVSYELRPARSAEMDREMASVLAFGATEPEAAALESAEGSGYKLGLREAAGNGLGLLARVARASASAVKEAAVSLAAPASEDAFYEEGMDEGEFVTVVVRRDGKYFRERRLI